MGETEADITLLEPLSEWTVRCEQTVEHDGAKVVAFVFEPPDGDDA